MKYLQRVGSGRLVFRRAYPNELRPFIPGSPREMIRTLEAKAIDEPGALERYKQARAAYELTLTQARKEASGAYDTLDAALIAYLTQAYIAEELAVEDEV